MVLSVNSSNKNPVTFTPPVELPDSWLHNID